MQHKTQFKTPVSSANHGFWAAKPKPLINVTGKYASSRFRLFAPQPTAFAKKGASK